MCCGVMVFIGSLDVVHKKTVWPQFIGGIGATLVLLEVGAVGGWTSPYLAKLTAEDSGLPVTSAEASWIAASMNVGRPFGAIIGSLSVEYFGSKKSLLFSAIPIALCWILTLVADAVVWLYAARFFGGVGFGMSYSCFPLYLGEISDPSIRGALVGLASSGLAIGTLAGNLVGAYLSMTLFAYVALVPMALIIAIFTWLPESPHYLVRNEKDEAAEKSIAWYHREADARTEVKQLKEFVNSMSLSFMDRIREFNVPKNRKSGIIIVMLYMFMQLSGLNTVVFYMEIILTKAQVKSVDPASIVIVAAIFAITSGLFAMYLVEKCGRRIVQIISSVGVGATMVALGTHFLLLESDYDVTKLEWLPITSVIVFQLFVSVGLVPIPSTFLSELFSPNIKSIAACVSSISAGIFAFAASKSYQPLVDVVGEKYVFWMYALIMVLSVLFTWFCVPETKGKSLQEIQK